jgi:hypothetical protein
VWAKYSGFSAKAGAEYSKSFISSNRVFKVRVISILLKNERKCYMNLYDHSENKDVDLE